MTANNPTTPPGQRSGTGTTKDVETSEPFNTPKQVYMQPYDLENIEDLEEYRPGGLHPVDMFDMLLDNRFEVCHKLGSGGIATVWLCYEKAVKKWKAIKINVAERSHDNSPELRVAKLLENSGDASQLLKDNHIAMPLETFWIEGPNGRHLCTVLPVLGPRLSDWRHMSLGTDAARINKVCYQLTKGLDFLHSHGICHGDFRPENILMQLKGNGLDDLEPEQLFELLHYPDKSEVLTLEGKRSPHAPEWAVDPLWWSELREYISDDVAIVDFGEAFEESQPPKSLGIPKVYAAPEVIYGGVPAGIGSDVWSLAYTIMVTRTGMPLDPSVWGPLSRMERFAGPIPSPYRRAAAEKLQRDELRMSGEETGTEKSVPPSEVPGEDDENLKSLTGDMTSESCVRELELEMGIELWEQVRVSEEEKAAGNERKWKSVHYHLPEDEVASLAGLLSKMFKYRPDERISAGMALKYPWFKEYPNSIGTPSVIGDHEHATSVKESLPVDFRRFIRLAGLREGAKRLVSMVFTRLRSSMMTFALIVLIPTVLYHLYWSQSECERIEVTKIIII